MSRLAQLIDRVEAGTDQDLAPPLKHNEGLRVIYNVLCDGAFLPRRSSQDFDGVAEPSPVYGAGALEDFNLTLAQRVEATLKASAPSQWRGVDTKERMVKGLLYEVLASEAQIDAVFNLLKGRADF